MMQQPLLYLPKGRYLKPLTLNYHNIVADFLWIKAITYFGEHYITDQKYDWFYHMLNLVEKYDGNRL